MSTNFFIQVILLALFYFEGIEAFACADSLNINRGECFDPAIESCNTGLSLNGNFCPELKHGVVPFTVIKLIFSWVAVLTRSVHQDNHAVLFLEFNSDKR